MSSLPIQHNTSFLHASFLRKVVEKVRGDMHRKSLRHVLLLVVMSVTLLLGILSFSASEGVQHATVRSATPLKDTSQERCSRDTTLAPEPSRRVFLPPVRTAESLTNGVVLLRMEPNSERLLSATLPYLNENYLLCHPYPVSIFHEGVSDHFPRRVAAALSNALGVAMEYVPQLWIRSSALFWMQVWFFPSLAPFDLFMRLEPTAVITTPVLLDPLRQLQVFGCELLYQEKESSTTALWEPYLKWALEERLERATLVEVKKLLLDERTNDTFSLGGPVQFGTFSLQRSSVVSSVFMQFGDVPCHWNDGIRSLGLATVCATKLCELPRSLFEVVMKPTSQELPRLHFSQACALPAWESYPRADPVTVNKQLDTRPCSAYMDWVNFDWW